MANQAIDVGSSPLTSSDSDLTDRGPADNEGVDALGIPLALDLVQPMLRITAFLSQSNAFILADLQTVLESSLVLFSRQDEG
jgi:hypothetical protein